MMSVATLIAVLVITLPPIANQPVGREPAPYVVKAGNVPVGLIYSVETLAALAARQPAGVSSRIAAAIRDQTPIVVMWTIPPSPDFGLPPRPYQIAIVERNRNEQAYGNASWSKPLWILQDAKELAQLDSRTQFDEVGAMAAFPPEAFAPGRKLVIYSDQRSDDGKGQHVSRVGLFDWDPTREQKR
jgi:hypothetical protein